MLVRRLKTRGATMVVEAHGEVLFLPSGILGNWTRRFSARVREFAAQEAPSNKRPRWAHYGAPLKTTMTASTSYHPSRMRVYSAVGSKSPHALYVDQNTNVFAGNSPWAAAVLPPYQWGSASLYEATWKPGGADGRRQVAPVMIQGQQGQFFMDKAVNRGFRSMRLRSAQLPAEGASKMTGVLRSTPSELLTPFAQNAGTKAAFKASLEEWRQWRDAAWDAGEGLGRGGGVGSRAHARHVEKAQAAKSKTGVKKAKAGTPATKKAKGITRPAVPAGEAKSTHKPTPQEIHNKQRIEAQREEKATIKAFIANKFPGSQVKYDTMSLYNTNGRFHWVIVVTVNGVPHKYDVPSGIR